MAKRKKKTKPAAEPKAEETKTPPPPAGTSARDFFNRIGEGLKSTGQTAERYARVGVGVAELEKLRLELRLAQSNLGETVVKCWDEAPDIGVTSHDTAIKKSYNEVKALRRKIRELESRIAGLRSGT